MNFHDHQISEVPSFNKGFITKSKNKRKSNKSLKVVYISSPMKVKTSASRFRSLVQELTGKNSDISQYIEPESYGSLDFLDFGHNNGGLVKETCENNQVVSPISSEETPTSSDSFLGPMDNVFSSQLEELFSSNTSFCDISHEFDVLGSYDELW